MSLGGAPNSKVEAALAVAEANNVIVLAAAGNQVPTRQVVYPARYSNVIAVAASNYDRSNWEFSSKGSAIAVSAPGQNVWTAKYRLIGERPYFCIEPSSGTSYAVATTAGVAALWLSYHRKTLSERPDIDRSKTFKALAACTAKPFDKVSDPADYGGGIIDAAALLAEPLPERDGPTWNQSGPCARALRAVPPRPLS
jgi:subtilisin family serine protease